METPAEAVDGPDYDPRTSEQIRYDAIGDQVREATRLVREVAETVRELTNGSRGNVQTVVHRTEGMGSLAIVFTAICSAVCMLCVVFVVVEFNRQNSAEVEYRNHVDGQLRDLDAWRGVHSNDIAALKADVKQVRESRK